MPENSEVFFLHLFTFGNDSMLKNTNEQVFILLEVLILSDVRAASNPGIIPKRLKTIRSL